MPRPGSPRVHRLPQWKDQILIPAPLDLSITDVAGKSPLPTIIVTPCSPTPTHNFCLAYIPSPPNPTIRERIQSYYKPTYAPTAFRTRSVFCVFFFLFLTFHLLAHRLAVPLHPRLEFASANAMDTSLNGDRVVVVPPHQSLFDDWFNFSTEADHDSDDDRELGDDPIVPFDHDVGGWLDY